MSIEAIVAILASAATTITTVVIFFVESRQRAAEAVQARRLEAVRLALDAMDGAARRAQRPAIVRLWARPELEFALVVPRLLVNLSPKDVAVGQWALGQVGRMEAAHSDQEVVRIGVAMTLTLSEWGSGVRPTSWFAEQLNLAAVPRASGRRRRSVAAAGRLGVEFALLIVAAASIRYTWESLQPSELRSVFSGRASRL